VGYNSAFISSSSYAIGGNAIAYGGPGGNGGNAGAGGASGAGAVGVGRGCAAESTRAVVRRRTQMRAEVYRAPLTRSLPF
jgi:hypothetical protein